MPQIPFVISRDGREPQYFDIFSRLLQDRIVFLQGQVDDESAGLIVAQIRYLMAEDPKKDIHLYVNSPGGSVTAGHGHLRHDAGRLLRRRDLLHRPGGQHGGPAADGRGQGEAVRPAERPDHDPPAARRPARHVDRVPDLCEGIPSHEEAPERHPGQAHRARRSTRSKRTPTATTSCPRPRPRTTGWSITSWSTSRPTKIVLVDRMFNDQ